MTRIARFALVALGCLLAGCQSLPPSTYSRFEYAELHMATMFNITLYAPSQQVADEAARAAFERVIALEQVMSDYDTQSELSVLCRQPPGQPVRVSEDLFRVLAASHELARRSQGAFDPTIGPMVQLWRKSRKSRVLPTASEIAAARNRVGWRYLKLDATHRTVTLERPDLQLDLGGIGKGFTADEVLKVLRQRGLRSAMVAASGDIALGDAPPGKKGWRIGVASIDHPTEGLTRELCLANAAVSTSGDTEQFVVIGGRRYSHIVDPATGLGLTHRIGVTVVAPNATTTDGLDTTISVLGAEKGMAFVRGWRGASALIVLLNDEHKRYLESPRFKRYLSPSR